MFFSRDQLLTAVKKLDDERVKQHATGGCQEPRTDASGNAARPLRTRLKDDARNARANRIQIELTDDQYEIQPVPYGVHGIAYLAIDPETLEVHCGACAGELDATVTEGKQP